MIQGRKGVADDNSTRGLSWLVTLAPSSDISTVAQRVVYSNKNVRTDYQFYPKLGCVLGG